MSGAPHDARRREAVAAVVLAAGRATRMGGAKLLLPVGGRPMIARVVDAALGSRASPVIVVVGHEGQAVRAALGDRAVTIVVNPEYAAGMSTSLRAGLSAVDPAADGAVVLLGDQPFVSPALIDALIERFAAGRHTVVRPVWRGVPAHPVVVAASLFPELGEASGDVGGRHVLARHGAEVCLVTVADPRELVDVDRPDDYEEAKDA